ncbi:MAG: peptidoglycan DD-metalloendopeptidase family protein, partial [Actinomycetota bacterium]
GDDPSGEPTTTAPNDGADDTSPGGGQPDGVPTDDGQTDGEPGADEPEVADPLSGEGPGEEAPGIDPDLPPPDTYGGQEPYRAPEVLWSSVAEAERKLQRALEVRREAVADVRALRLRQKHLELARDALDGRSQETIQELGSAQDRFRGRAITDYRLFAAGLGPEPTDVIRPTDLEQVMERRRGARLAEAALGVGSDDLSRLHELRQSLDGETRSLLDRLRLVVDYQVEAVAAVTETEAEIEQATIEAEAFRAGSEIFISGVVFPIGGPHDLPIIDSFGFPRMTGTPDEHWHEGIDLFAPRGTPLIAAERGLVTRIGSGRLGGLKLWVIGESGTEWYYAHLDSFAPGLHNGQVVEAGELVGYVGNTGNAVGTPPHLHLQMHPDGGRPVNPYPLLKTVSDLDQAAIADGTHRGYRYDPFVANRLVAVTQSPDE